MPMPVTIPLLILISVFIAIVAPMMLPPLHFPLSVFEFSAHPQLTLHFRDDVDVHLTQRRVVDPANKNSACLDPPSGFAK